MTVRQKSMSMFCKYFVERSESLCKHVLWVIVVFDENRWYLMSDSPNHVCTDGLDKMVALRKTSFSMTPIRIASPIADRIVSLGQVLESSERSKHRTLTSVQHQPT
jgi:hypothetical protein